MKISGENARNRKENHMANNKKNVAAKADPMQKIIVGIIVVIAVVVIAIVAVTVSLIGASKPTPTPDKGESQTNAATTTPSTSAPSVPTDPWMLNIYNEIDSMKVEDFEESTEKTEYVKISVKLHGDIIVRLRPDVAPITAANFQGLVADGFYNGLTFHRVRKGFMIQGGDPKGNGTGSAGEKIEGEFKENGFINDLSHIKGVISMARNSNDMNSATSQFFICNADSSKSLDGKYAAFGYVVAGLDTVDSVSDVRVTWSNSGEMSSPVTDVVIEKACFVAKK